MIKRDGSSTSLWQGTIEPYRSGSGRPIKQIYDVAIVGGGMTGVTTALLLQLAGKSVILLEANNLGFGTTGGTTAHLNTVLDTPYTKIISNFGESGATMVASAAKDALHLVEHNVSKYNIDCGFTRTDGYIYSKNDKQTGELRDILDACNKVGVPTSMTKDLPMDLVHDSAMKMINQAKFNPLEYLYAVAKHFENAGGVIAQQTRVTQVDEDEIIKIETSSGGYQARALVYATHIPPGINIIHMRYAPWRSYAMALQIKGSYPNQLIYDMDDPYHYYRTQVVNGVEYLIAGGNDHKTGHDHDTSKCFMDLEAYLRRHLNIVGVAYTWSSQYYEPVDGLPYIGHLPGHDNNVYVATGYGGNGMTYSHVAARVLKEMICNEARSYDEVFNPSRIKPIASFKDIVANTADVAKTFVQKFVPAQHLESFSGLAPGEGVIARIDGQDIALHKDENGAIHAIDPVCTHMGCNVVWNLAEQSWDCPCHGARYNADGTVLNGPTTKDLSKVEIHSHEGVTHHV
jgi:glycine/D-amino acid oxidase-like deaminating enzyme/nitrite reductase/ring-hydroxylating ferredoxin subunit